MVLMVVGAGSLGTRVVARYRAENIPVLAVTRSPTRHDDLRALGAQAFLPDQAAALSAEDVLIAVPPGGRHAEYLDTIRWATCRWNGQGTLALVSSTGVYPANPEMEVTEDSPVNAEPSPVGAVLLEAERLVRSAEGCVVRLGGLYDFARGPHRLYLRRSSSTRSADGLLNLIHYDDAAALCCRVLARGGSGRTYLGCDGTPVARQVLADAAYHSLAYRTAAPRENCRFAEPRAGNPAPGRCCNASATYAALDWQPQHSSFIGWLDEYGEGSSTLADINGQ